MMVKKKKRQILEYAAQAAAFNLFAAKASKYRPFD